MFALFLGLAVGVLGLHEVPGQAAAQDERPVVVEYLAGPYKVGVLTQRSNLAVGRAVFTIFVRDAQGGAPVADARVIVRTHHQVEGTEGWSSAFNSPSAPEAYRAQVNLEDPGIWDAVIEIESPLGGGIISVGSLHVPNARSYTSGSYVFVGVFAVLLLGGGYLWWTINRNQRRRIIAESGSPGSNDLPREPDAGDR